MNGDKYPLLRFLLIPVLAGACTNGGAGPRLPATVVADAGERVAVTTAEGWTVTLTEATVAVADLEFTTGSAVGGELPGNFVVDLAVDGITFGTATLAPGGYDGASLTFTRGVDGHTALLRGTATRAGEELDFQAVVDVPRQARLVGIPFAATLEEGSVPVLGLRLVADDLFDGVELAAVIEAGQPAHTALARNLQLAGAWRIVLR